MAKIESTASLLAQVREGDSGALSRLLRRNLGPLRAWARGKVPPNARDRFDTDDLVQESLLALVPRLAEIEHRGAGAIQAYLRQAFLNRLRNEIRRTGRRPDRAELPSGLEDDAGSPLDRLVDAESQDIYERCLARLKHQDQAAVFLRMELGLKYEEIAAELDKPTANAARMTVSRALVRLAEMMKDERKKATKP